MKRLFILLIFALSFTLVEAQTLTFDVLQYDAQVEPDISNKSVKGKVTVIFKSMTNNLAEIKLNAGSLEIDKVSENDVAIKFEKQPNLLIITLTKPAKLNEKRTIEIEYHGIPKFGVRFFPEQNQVYTIFSTSQWMPCVDAPEDRAKFRLELVLPKDLQVVGNGEFIKQTKLSNGKTSSVWEQKNENPTYLYGFAAGKFREVIENYKGVKLRYLAPASFSETEVKQIFRETKNIIDFFESKAGVKYANKTYTQVLPIKNAEQEMSSFTVLREDYGNRVLKDEKDIWLGIHEFSHQWWGNMVTNKDWTHFWLNEGITNFMTAAYIENRFGRDAYLKEISDYKISYEKVRDAGKDKPLVFPDWNKPTREDRTLVYDKGAYVTHLLREDLGEEKFWQSLKDYTQKYWGKSVTTKDFQSSFEKSSGRDLSEFFKKWIY
ncbi:MAG TPA: M1 family metallopeptidase [Pyrinomonadaceae bacterium]|nr:M1 family metallopeptidase [Pyrinomonadaceae bacterium]